jgi:hypothetical protein
MDGLHLGRIHGNARLRDDMAEVCDRGGAESTLGALDEELLLSKLGGDGTEMAQVVGPCIVVD